MALNEALPDGCSDQCRVMFQFDRGQGVGQSFVDTTQGNWRERCFLFLTLVNIPVLAAPKLTPFG